MYTPAFCYSSPRREEHGVPRRDALDIRHLIFDEAGDHPSAANGLHQVARQLALEQYHAGDRPRLVFLSDLGRDGDSPPEVPEQVITMRGPKLMGRRIGLDRDVMDEVLRGTNLSTLFHIHGVRQPLLIPVTRALRRRAIPYVITAHSRFAHVYSPEGKLQTRKTATYVRLFERPVLEAARFIHSLTPHESDVLHRLAPAARIELLPNAAYSSRIDGIPRPPTRAPSPDFPVFGFFGRLAIEHKGLDLLVDGFARYRHAGGRGKLMVFGSGNTHPELAAMCANAGVADVCTIEGPRFGQDKIDAASRWDFYVTPSRFDHMPLAALEAGLMGLPLVISEGTGLLDQTRTFGAGMGIVDFSAQGVAEVMHAAEKIGPPAWFAQSQNAYRMALSVGDWTAIAAALRELYLGRQPASGMA